ncbi:hypothetical protein OG568_24545 [Streptomyces sp. NBC_01450]|uniref:hypothetical protein n=1 Tax=Streptomyces sp. NBC_01450 TaxID=2903871 RepID=UPI002E354031|nr:hypothetical protein [Streptomyces sp. NBC_01450]
MTELVLRARRTTALFERDAVLLDRGGMRLRIPLTAIETVRTGGGSRRRVIEIVLTSADATPVVHTLSPPNATAATAFADAVNAALPVRDAVEPRADGAPSVTTVPVPPRTEQKDRWTTSRERRVPWAFGALFALGTALAAATGGWVFIVLWAASYTPFLVGCALTHIVYRVTVDWWLLRRRGITVLAVYKDSDYVGEVLAKTYSFTDAAGEERTFRGSGRLVATDPERIEVTYDPCAPKRMTTRKGPAVRMLSVLAYVLLGLPVTAATAAYPPVSLIILLSAL